MELRVTDLAISRGDLVLATGLTFRLRAGEALVVTGENGSGKSTLLRTLAGLHPRDDGGIELSMKGRTEPVSDLAHYLGHENAMKPDLTVRENLVFWQRISAEAGEGPSLIDEAADALAIEPLLDLPFSYLSAGQRRRVALARLWVAPRPLWLMDEPTAALDARSEIAVRDMIEAHRAEGGMAIVATHVELGLVGAAYIEMGAA